MGKKEKYLGNEPLFCYSLLNKHWFMIVVAFFLIEALSLLTKYNKYPFTF